MDPSVTLFLQLYLRLPFIFHYSVFCYLSTFIFVRFVQSGVPLASLHRVDENLEYSDRIKCFDVGASGTEFL